MSEGFSFQQFNVRHDRCAMKVGTDGVLMGAWAAGGARLLDVGAGSGLISLMLAQRFPDAEIDGVELNADAARQALDNVAASPFAARIRIHAMAFQQMEPAEPYDAIVSNPPFFLQPAMPAGDARATARHAQLNFFTDLFSFSRRWLTATGQVSLIVPHDGAEAIADEAYLAGLMLCRRIAVTTRSHKPPERCLLAFCRRRSSMPELGEACLLDDDGARSAWYDALTRDFYR